MRSEKANLHAADFLSIGILQYFPQKLMTVYTCSVEILSLHGLHLKEISQTLQTTYPVSVVPNGKSCS